MNRRAGSEPEILVLDDPEAVSAAAAERIASALRAAVEERGRADWATTGGSAPSGIYRRLAVPPLRDDVPWRAVHLWWGDDRYVPRDHPNSNVLAADAVLVNAAARAGQSGWGEDAHDLASGSVGGATIPAANVHPFPVGEAIGSQVGPGWAAARYEQELRASGIATADGWPMFDVVLLGIGPDGHLLSVFPDSAAFDEAQAWAMAIPAPSHVEPRISRVTLTPRVLDPARMVLVVVHGEGKAEIVGRVFADEREPRRLPALLVRRPGVTWLLDRAAGEGLPAALR